MYKFLNPPALTGLALLGVRTKPDIVRLFDGMSGQNKRCPAWPVFVRYFRTEKPSVAENFVNYLKKS